MIQKNILLLLLCINICGSGISQYNTPEPGHVFDDSTIPKIDIYIDQDSLDWILADSNVFSYKEFPATFIFDREGEKDTIQEIGFRLRGNTSRGAEKPSFKISFNTFESGRKYHGIEKMNLNGEHNDPSIMRTKLCMDMFKWAGVPSSRTNHVLLYINDEFRGIYINVEHLDEEFVSSRYQEDDGNLFKCLYPADLLYKGDDPDLYKEEFWGRQAYALKTNKEEDDYSFLAHFIDILNNNDGEELKCKLEQVFHVENYLKVIALDLLTSNWDGPIWNKNNFYLYHPVCDGKVNYLPYDLDNTFGIDWFGVDWANTDIYKSDEWGQGDRPIFTQLMNVPSYRDKVSNYLRLYIEEFFNKDYLESYLLEKRDLIIPFRAEDVYASYDYGWDIDDFWVSYTSGIGAHVPVGILEYVEEKVSSVLSQLELNEIEPSMHYGDIDLVGDTIRFSFIPEGDFESVVLQLKMNGVQEDIILSSDDMIVYEHELVTKELIEYQLELKLQDGASWFWPSCEFVSLAKIMDSEIDLIINEVMSSNDSAIADEYGEFDDWIEIYNPNNAPITLSKYFLSDDKSDPTKFRLPDIGLVPDDYILIWADGQEEQGPNHANFRLSSNGEFLGMFEPNTCRLIAIDTVLIPPMEADISYGRIPNGMGPFQVTDAMSPDANNDDPSSFTFQNQEDIRIFPNPSSGELYIDAPNRTFVQMHIYGSMGNLVYKSIAVDNFSKLDLSNKVKGLSGLYYLILRETNGKVHTFKVEFI